MKKLLFIGLCLIGLVSATPVYADSFQENQEELSKLNASIDRLTVDIKDYSAKIKDCKTTISKDKKEIATLETKYEKYSKVVKENMRTIQAEGGKPTTLQIIFSGKNITEMLSAWSSAKTIMTTQASQTKELKEVKDELTAKNKKLGLEQEKLTKLEKESNKKLADVASKKEDVLIQLATFDSNYAKELKEMRSSNSIVAKALKSQYKNDKSVIGTAFQFLGLPYVWGGTSPTNGFDCSGYMQYIFAQHGISLPRVSESQSTVGTYVDLADLQAGDLIFWGGVGSAHHVGLYIGNGMYVHAPQPGETITIQSMNYYSPSFGSRVQ